ncbi:DUF7674 family protein [Candidatus Nitrotoga sp. AM1P]|uniref:DUF7674 family protein n=1 Tax=Candidatus Nitrotoga sp. AM1P TaxID=2559597 RepID=UPI0010B10916|nr:hypothetical protein [Candidatus Nitrotoga sp. AM1P]BBJ23061.1 hypothetical protein W01_09880 [Candidatus Nitrotoga sp. AM1P]
MDRHQIIKNFILVTPTFSSCWKDYINYWEQEDPGISNDILCYVNYFVENFSDLTIEQRKATLEIVENGLTYGDSSVKDALATCFLEALITAIDLKKIDFNTINLLGNKSTEYCRAWNDFSNEERNID